MQEHLELLLPFARVVTLRAHPAVSLLVLAVRLKLQTALSLLRDTSTLPLLRLRLQALATRKSFRLRLSPTAEQQFSAMLWLEFILTSARLCISTQTSPMLPQHSAPFTAKLLSNFTKNRQARVSARACISVFIDKSTRVWYNGDV